MRNSDFNFIHDEKHTSIIIFFINRFCAGCEVRYLRGDNNEHNTTLPAYVPITFYAEPRFSHLSFSIDDGGPVVVDGLYDGCLGWRMWFQVTVDAALGFIHARRLYDNRTWQQQLGRLDAGRGRYTREIGYAVFISMCEGGNEEP